MRTWVRDLAVALLVPGWRQWPGRRVLAVVLLGLGVALPLGVLVAGFATGRGWVALSLDTTFLGWSTVALLGAFGARVAAVLLWLAEGERNRERLVSGVAGLVVVALPLGMGAVGIARARSDIAPVFTETEGPLFDAAVSTSAPTSVPTTTTAPTTTPAAPSIGAGLGPIVRSTTTTTTTEASRPLPARPRSGVDPARVADVYNILLLGGDAGPGRGGLRTDTMMLLSVHTPSGRASLISLPRDMKGLLFPPDSPLGRRYPYGFTELANAVYPIVSSKSDLRAAYEVDDIRPGVVAAAEAIGYSLDVTIHDYVLIDMQGFLDLIDALGGVTVDVPKQVPMPGNVPGARTQYPDTIGPGTIHMDGSTALGYVRSRKADSDFQRTARQRALLAALARQVSFSDVVANYGGVTSAIGGTLRTSLSPDELAGLLALIGGETAIVESVGLVPPLVSITSPDFQKMAEVVGAVRVAIAEGHDSGY